jgi:hypothetical protein
MGKKQTETLKYFKDSKPKENTREQKRNNKSQKVLVEKEVQKYQQG